ncbi:MAG: MTH938/NDUFAF3 family protein [Marinifilaceae bacterium]
MNQYFISMKPHINSTSFGYITIEGETYDHDVVINSIGDITKRKKKLSKRVYGTSHCISEEELQYVMEEGVVHLIIGAGQYDTVELSEPAKQIVKAHQLQAHISATPTAIQLWNSFQEKVVGLFHVTC